MIVESMSEQLKVNKCEIDLEKLNKNEEKEDVNKNSSECSEENGEKKMTRKQMRRAKRDKNTKVIENNNKTSGGNSRPNSTPRYMLADDPKYQKRVANKLLKQQVPMRYELKTKMPIFSHLKQQEKGINMSEKIALSNSPIHPSFVSFGLQLTEGIIFSSRARSVRLIRCLKDFIKDYKSINSKEFIRDFEIKLSPSLNFLSECRPNSSGMATIIKFLKLKFAETISLSEEDMKGELIDFLDRFLYERIFMAGDFISSLINQKISDGDTLLIYSKSNIILKGILDAYKGGNKKFKVIVTDCPPRYEAREMLGVLVKSGIKCTYIGLNAISVVMKSVNKIIISADSLLSNGAVLSPIGSGLLALVGISYRVPVLVCCETFNFSERAQIDAIVYNELGDPDSILVNNRGQEIIPLWHKLPNVTLLNLYYDVIQPKHVSAVITELGIIPCSSAPVVLRVKN